MKGFRDYLTEGKKAPVPHFEPANTATPVDKNKRKKNDRNVKEGTENLKELSTELLGRYKTAAKASANAADKAGDFKKGNKRFSGVVRATKKQFKNETDSNFKEDVESIEEGWLFGSRYKKIGNKSGSTHRITFKHIPTDSKHTVDVTAPTDRHAEAHVHRHVLGGRNGTAPIRITRMQHLHEDAEDLQELSIKKLNAYQSKAMKDVRQIKSNSNYGADRGAKKLLANRKAGIERANKSRIAQSEDLDEALEIRHAINHGDSQARHHAREYKKAVTTYNAGHAKLASQHRAPTRDQEDELINHYETAQHHHREYKKRLKQLDAGKNKNEDLQELSKKTLGSYIGKAAVSIKQNTRRAYKHQSAALDTRDTRNDHDAFGDEQRDVNLKTKWAKPFVKKINNRATGIRRAAAKLAKEDLDLQEISKGLAARYLEKAKPAYDAKRQELNKPDYSGPVWGDMKARIKKFSDKVDKLGRRREGINRAQDRLKEEEGLQELSKNTLQSYMARAKGDRNKAASKKAAADAKATTAINSYGSMGKPTGYQALTKKAALKHTINTQSSVSKAADRTIEKRTKGIAAARARLTKEGLDEGIISRTLNAIKNANKKLTPGSARIAQTREKVGYDNAKGTDLRPRGKALRKVEKIEWSKANPVTRPKPIVPMGKLPDKLWSTDSDKPKPKRVTDDSLDRPMFRKVGALSRRFKTEDLEESGTLRIITQKSSKDAKKKAAAAEKRAERKKVRDQQNKPDARSDYQKKLDALIARIKNRPFGQTSEELEPKGGSKFLKEKPKRDPKTGKLEKSKAAQKVEDCIKISGKKEKIDTEPTYNPLTTASNGSGSPNA